MPTTHTVAQGETLTRIAKKYGLGSWKTIYNHSENAEFRAKRNNPNIIYPGDKVVIPDREVKAKIFITNKRHVFTVATTKETLKIKLQDANGTPLSDHKATITLNGKTTEVIIDGQGFIEIPLDECDANEADLEITPKQSDSATGPHKFKLKIGELDPIDTISGVQARCNALGYDCGKVDGIYGDKTKEGLLDFQRVHNLPLTGEVDQTTQQQLIEAYGC